jgi:threonyl-tRNA synthetase
VSDQIKVTLPDGSVREVPVGTTPFAIAHSISPRLAEAVVVAKIRTTGGEATTDGAEEQTDAAHRGAGTEESMYAEAATSERIVDLSEPLNEDVNLWLLKETDPDALRVVRHSAAHVMATAIMELYPEVKLGHGPATDSGFFYDIYREVPFTPDDLAKIEERMAEVVAKNEPFRHEYVSHTEALTGYEEQEDFMKAHFVARFTKPGEQVSLYRNGSFVDFCRGPHVPSTGRVRAFKVMSIAGAYWLGDEKNPQLQRIYGTAFYNKKDLDAHFKHLEEIKARDHRVLGKQLDLFSIQEIAGPGLIFFHPKGAIVRKEMESWMREECLRRGYELVYTPHIMKRDLWKISGHDGVYSRTCSRRWSWMTRNTV